MSIRIFITLLLYNILTNLYSQNIIGNNLVPNPGFEVYSSCPDNLAQIQKAFPWKDCGIGTSDFYHLCSNNQFILNYISLNPLKNGNGYAGIWLYLSLYSNWREYLQNMLINELIKNRKYCINLFCKSSFDSNFLIKNIGIYFSKSFINNFDSLNPGKAICDSVPQIKNKNGFIDSNWLKLTGIFNAEGGERFIVIGNFDDDNNTIGLNINGDLVLSSYYFIDDVSVCECSFDINLGPDTSLCESETLILNPNLPNATYTWQDSSHVATFEVKQPGTYWVRAYVAEYDVYSSDTIVITQGDDNFCNPPLTIPNVITPNGDGANDNFVIQNAESYNITLQIYNRWGRLIYENTNYQNDFSCKTCASGVYYYVIKAKSKRNGREKEYKGSLTIVTN